MKLDDSQKIPKGMQVGATRVPKRPQLHNTPPKMGPKINVGSEPQPTLILGLCEEPYLKEDVSQKTPHGILVGAMSVSKRPQLHLRWNQNQCRFGAPTDIDFRMLQGAVFETRSVPEDPSLYASWRHESPKETTPPPKMGPKSMSVRRPNRH